VWAETVADHDGVEWSSFKAAHSRQPDRVARACALLTYRLTTLIGLAGTQHRARSLTTRRADGHDPDTTTRDRDDYWTTRQGWEGALLMVSLHQRAEKFTGRAPADRQRTPCPKCHRPDLIREHHNNLVRCRSCGELMSDDDYDAFLDAAFQAHGIPIGNR
jgi:ribosomal protein L37AE/L43A